MNNGMANYLLVQSGQIPPMFALSARIGADPIDISWEAHANLLDLQKSGKFAAVTLCDPIPEFSLLDLKIELAKREMRFCGLCPRNCKADRINNPGGFCGAGRDFSISWEGILYGEEQELIPSHEVFLSGCSMRCAFCSSFKSVANPVFGRSTTPKEMAKISADRKKEGALNLNIAGGDPMIHLLPILETLKLMAKAPTPLVWNSNMYASPKTMSLLDGVADLYLGDIHFGNDACAQSLAETPRYLESITRSFRAAYESGAAVIIRHLVLPGHFDCCLRPILAWAETNFPATPLHVMPQYLPEGDAPKHKEIARSLTEQEKREAERIAQSSKALLYEYDASASRRSHIFEALGAKKSPADSVEIIIAPTGEIVISRLTGDLALAAKSIEHSQLK